MSNGALRTCSAMGTGSNSRLAMGPTIATNANACMMSRPSSPASAPLYGWKCAYQNTPGADPQTEAGALGELRCEESSGGSLLGVGQHDDELHFGAEEVRGRVDREVAGALDGFPYLSLIHISEPTRQAEISYAVFCL